MSELAPYVSPLSPMRSLRRIFVDNLGTPGYYLRRDSQRHDDAGMPGETVLLIHGFFQTRAVMNTLERRLRADGFRVLSFHLGGLLWNFNTRGVPTLAARIDRKIRRLRERYGVDKIHIGGHSMGGLIGRYLVQEAGGEEYTSTVITLGSPHHGTPTAFLGAGMGLLFVSKAMWQLFPRSPLVRKLNKGRFPEGCRLVSVYSKHDLICPWRSSVLSEDDGTDVRNVVVGQMGHMSLVEDPWVYGLILRELVERPTDAAAGPVGLGSIALQGGLARSSSRSSAHLG